MVTRQATSDPFGVFSFRLDEPGVWVVAVSKIIPARNESKYDQDIRGILMIPVEETYPKEDTGSSGQQQDITELEAKIKSLEQENNDLKNNLSAFDSKLAGLEHDDEEDEDHDSEEAMMQNMVYAALAIAILGFLISIVALARKK